MRKIFVSVFFVLFAFAFTQTANAVNVSSVSYFQGLYASGGLQTVDMTKSITFSYSVRLGDSGNNLNMTVNLGGYALSFIGGSSPSGNGGQMNVKNSNLTFISGGIMFSANTASSAGGAIYNDTSSTLNFTDVEANFTSNSSVYYGGAIVNYRADINFTGSTVSFANNSVTISSPGYGGGAIYNEHASLSFTSSSLTFLDNKSSGSFGGAIYANIGSTITFTNGDISFSSNSASYGGAVFSKLSAINFTESPANFLNNKSDTLGGALVALDSIINFIDGGANFLNNRSGNSGGALSASNSKVNFKNGKTDFTGNSSIYGGAIESGSFSEISFTSGVIAFTGNSARYGGAIHSNSGSIINFTDAVTSFLNNKNDSLLNEGYGGALIALDSQISFKGGKTDFIGNSSTYGGAIEANLSTISFTNTVISFTSNSARYGGAIENDKSLITFTASTVSFTGNRATTSLGGAIYNIAGSTINFTNSDVNFTKNESYNWGAAIENSNAVINFTNGNVNFTGNFTNRGSGGAIDSDGASAIISFSNVHSEFRSNKGYDGGAIYNSGGSAINFTSGSVNFTYNTSVSSGGAIYNSSGSAVNFTGGSVKFIGNTSGLLGGAIYGAGEINFDSGSAVFENNYAKGIKNDIHLGNNATLTVKNGAYVELNGALTGNGILNVSSNGNVKFGAADSSVSGLIIDNTSKITVTINGNQNTKIYVDGNILLNTSSKLSLNYAGSFTADKRAVIYVKNATEPAIFTIDRQRASFRWETYSNNGYNYAGYLTFLKWNSFVADYKDITDGKTLVLNQDLHAGPSEGENPFGQPESASNITIDGSGYYLDAVSYLDLGFNFNNSLITFKNTGFKNFASSANGGAVFALGSTVTFTENQDFLFNTSMSSGGAISGDSAVMNFIDGGVKFIGNTANASGGAIYAANASNITFKASSLDISLIFMDNRANAVLNDIDISADSFVNFDAQGYAITLVNGIRITGAGTINKNGNGALIFEQNSAILSDFNINNGRAVLEDSVELKGKNIKIDAAGALDLQNESVNNVETRHFEMHGNLKIDIFTDGTNDLITAGSASIGGNLDIKSRVGKYENAIYEILITTQSSINGVFVNTSDYYHSGLIYALDYNDPYSVKLIVNGIYASWFGEIAGLSFNQKETAHVLDKLSGENDTSDELRDFITDFCQNGQDEQKIMLAQTSGYFLSNVIRSAAAGSLNKEIYDKVKERSSAGLWLQVKSGQEIFGKNENSIGDYKDSSLGILFGFDKYVKGKNIIWGVYGRFSGETIEQEQNKADGQKSGLGLYGGYVKEKYEIKAMLLGSYDIFNTERNVLGKTAKADINAMTISADIEASLKCKLNDALKLKPFFGIEIEDANYGDFSEKGADVLALEVSGGSYMRNAARIGAGVEYEKNRVSAYAKAEGKYLLSGAIPEIENEFRDTQIKFKSQGSEEGNIEIGIGAGGEIKAAKNFILYANINYYGAQNYSNVYGNIGVRYMFGE